MPTLKTDLRIEKWAEAFGFGDDMQHLAVKMGPRPIQMAHSEATGKGLVSNGHLGADIIRLEAGKGFAPHTHPGDHLLIVIGGYGTIAYRGTVRMTAPGQIYMIEGFEPHAVGAITDHVILAVGCPHKAVGDPDRMKIIEYTELLADFESLHCLICDKRAVLPDTLTALGCPHDPRA